MLDRRDFIRWSALGAGALLWRGAVDAWLGPVADQDGLGPTLILLELTGGNDGLNTVVPHADDRYHRARPALAIRADRVHRLDDVVGLAPELDGLARLFRDGQLAVVQGVGMPDPDRSHFSSLDRWHSASVARTPLEEGWLGRAIRDVPGGSGPLPGLCLGDRALPRVLHGSDRPVAATDSLHGLLPPESSRRVLRSKELADLDAQWGTAADREVLAAARALLDRLEGVAQMDLARFHLPSSPLGERLGDALRLILGGFEVPAIFIRLGGFDTHVRQKQVQPALLGEVDASLSAFWRGVIEQRLERRVMVLVYSEFGRRVAENGGAGTDHGSAGPAFILGGGMPGGLLGPHPDLENQDDGDVRMGIDFRRLLAQGLKHLRHPAPSRILPAGIEPLA